MKAWASIALLFVLVSLVIVAQEDDSPAECDYAAMGERLVEVGGGLAESEDPATALRGLMREMASAQVVCDGLVFTSEEYGLSRVTDPIEMPDGLYRAIIESGTTFSADFTEIEGDCGRGFFSVLSDEGRAEEVAEFESCIAVIAFDGREDWSLTFEKLGG